MSRDQEAAAAAAEAEQPAAAEADPHHPADRPGWTSPTGTAAGTVT
ncbi:hypothetical protein [Micromonospora wenchangensis]